MEIWPGVQMKLQGVDTVKEIAYQQKPFVSWNLTKTLIRMPSCLVCQRNQYGLDSFGRGSLKEQFCQIILESEKRIMEEKDFRFGYLSQFLMPQQPKIYTECKSLINSEREPTNEHSCEVEIVWVEW